ncbi:MAG: 4-hydroxy-tetrahydrodipicolinate reductase [Candidatus Heimdallarchaeota archaeon]|nr:4-hydroxy-tetrahydrodipicolinate reductase [Candidatus Heimdallarchaeota archaeon]
MTKICIIGITGRMGSLIAQEALKNGFTITGAITSQHNLGIGKTLRELEICNSDVVVHGSTSLTDIAITADVVLSFTNPVADIENLLYLTNRRTPLVIGTTGFSEEQFGIIRDNFSHNTACVLSANFSIGINLFYKIIESINSLPEDFDISIMEAHHSSKGDSPSGTAKQLANSIMQNVKDYTKIIAGRSGFELRRKDELEVYSIRAGGIPGIHSVMIAGKYEAIRLEHTVFSRQTFAEGALLAAEWVAKQTKNGLYTMSDVLTEVASR